MSVSEHQEHQKRIHNQRVAETSQIHFTRSTRKQVRRRLGRAFERLQIERRVHTQIPPKPEIDNSRLLMTRLAVIQLIAPLRFVSTRIRSSWYWGASAETSRGPSAGSYRQTHVHRLLKSNQAILYNVPQSKRCQLRKSITCSGQSNSNDQGSMLVRVNPFQNTVVCRLAHLFCYYITV